MAESKSPAGPLPPTRGVAVRAVRRLRRQGAQLHAEAPREDQLAAEEPLEIRVAGETLAITMRTPGGPGEDERLVLGFLFAEGVIAGRDDLVRISRCARPGAEGFANVLDAVPAGGARIDPGRVPAARRGTLISSACGLCGRTSIDDVLARLQRHREGPGPAVSGALLFAAVEALGGNQPRFARTGGIHAAVVVGPEGVLAAAEDVGRHNAVDKVVGALLLSGAIPAPPGAPARVLAVSGRASFELVQKAAMAGFAGLASVSAPSSLAAELAEATGLVLAGFVRGDGLNLYAGAERVG